MKAVGVTSDQITTGSATQLVEWTGGEAVPDEPRKRRVKRDAADRNEVTIKMNQTGAVVARMDVWVVWSNATATPGTPAFTQHSDFAKYEISEAKTWRFKFAIQPPSIITLNERPNLSGPKSTDVPGSNNPYTTNPAWGVADTAFHKWDLSRQAQATVRNPGSITQPQLKQGLPVAWCDHQPTAVDMPLAFPESDVEGNDDPLLSGQETNPYAASTPPDSLQHKVGEITSYDRPALAVVNGWGSQDRYYAVELNFNEFARLELWDGERTGGQFWFRISDLVQWHHYLKATFNGDGAVLKWENASSSSGTGHPTP